MSSDFSNRHADFYMHRGFVLSADPEVKPRAIDDARRDGDPQPARHERMTAAVARPAGLGPRLAAAAALRAGGPQEHHDRHHGAAMGFVARETDFRFHGVAAFAGRVRQERAAHTRYQMSDRWEIDRDLIREAVGLAFNTHAG
jgi:hypothetical protein